MTRFGLPVGPFAMEDIAGIDVGARIRQHRAHKAHDLTLPNGQSRPALTHLGVEPPRQRLEEIEAVELGRGGPHFLKAAGR